MDVNYGVNVLLRVSAVRWQENKTQKPTFILEVMEINILQSINYISLLTEVCLSPHSFFILRGVSINHDHYYLKLANARKEVQRSD